MQLYAIIINELCILQYIYITMYITMYVYTHIICIRICIYIYYIHTYDAFYIFHTQRMNKRKMQGAAAFCWKQMCVFRMRSKLASASSPYHNLAAPSCAKFAHFLVGFVGGSGRPDWLPTRVLMADTHSTLRRGAQTEFLQNL